MMITQVQGIIIIIIIIIIISLLLTYRFPLVLHIPYSEVSKWYENKARNINNDTSSSIIDRYDLNKLYSPTSNAIDNKFKFSVKEFKSIIEARDYQVQRNYEGNTSSNRTTTTATTTTTTTTTKITTIIITTTTTTITITTYTYTYILKDKKSYDLKSYKFV